MCRAASPSSPSNALNLLCSCRGSRSLPPTAGSHELPTLVVTVSISHLVGIDSALPLTQPGAEAHCSCRLSEKIQLVLLTISDAKKSAAPPAALFLVARVLHQRIVLQS